MNHVHPSPYSANAQMVRIKEVTHEAVPQVVFDLMLFDYANTNSNYQGCFTYRSDRIPDLYSVLPQAVVDLTVTLSNAQPHLRFSGDAANTYVVQASTNLVNWVNIGAAAPSGSGGYDFLDQTGVFPARYYRIVTQ
jgi:hypothetical protein